jgi:hypothetical protein
MASTGEIPVRKGLSGIAVFVLFSALSVAGYSLYRSFKTERELTRIKGEVATFQPRFDKFKEAVRDVHKQLTSVVFEEVDLTIPGWQPLSAGFYLIDLGLAPSGAGSKITGKVINATSVAHETLKFSVRVKKTATAFTIAHAAPGVAQPFEVIVGDVPPAEAKQAFVALESSTISFASSATRKRPGAEPPDSEALLR